jgi:hypothetical protein
LQAFVEVQFVLFLIYILEIESPRAGREEDITAIGRGSLSELGGKALD